MCSQRARRVPEVIDVWYDSGAMPFSQFGAPLRNEAEFEAAYPAQFICEALDQTRGWFYSLMAVGTLVFGRSSYENVVCVGLILDEAGVKMSKHLGNVLEPIPLMEAHGADALRWFFAASGSPWGARRIGHDALDEIVRKVLLTYWNTASFLVLYANAGGWSAADLASAPPVADRPLLDRWVLGELHAVVRDVTSALEVFDTAVAGRRLAAFIDDLSNWYVRRSRRRFWDGPSSATGAAAFATLYECVTTLSLLMAPITPFVTDYVWGVLRGAGAAESVHLASWPSFDPALIDPRLSERMALVRRLVELGRSARSGASVRTRQPLSRALIGASGFEDLPEELRAQIASELNVAALDVLSGGLVDYAVKPNFRSLGRRFGAQTPAVAAAIGSAPAADIAAGGAGGRDGDRHRGRLGGVDRRRRRDRDPDAASRLGGGHRRRRDGGDRHRGHAGAAPRGHRARGDQAGAGGAQERRPGRDRPDLAALVGPQPGGGRGARRARGADRRGGAGGRLRVRRVLGVGRAGVPARG